MTTRTSRSWTDEAGDPGIITMYAAPAAGDYLAENLADLTGVFGGSASSSATSCAIDPNADPGTVDATCDDTGTVTSETNTPMPSEMADALKNFKGMAATMRFNDGALELETAGDPGVSRRGSRRRPRRRRRLHAAGGHRGGAGRRASATAGSPTSSTRWRRTRGGQTSAADLMSQMAQASGLDLPADAETLAGDSVAVSVGSGFDPETLFGSGDPSSIPVAAKVKGDPEAINGVLDKVRGQIGTEESQPPPERLRR